MTSQFVAGNRIEKNTTTYFLNSCTKMAIMNYSETPINKHCQPRMIDYLVLASSVIITLLTLTWLLVISHYGIDLTDESFYLIWMSNPWIYPVSFSQFGFIYHPLYQLFHGDIPLLRQANILIIFGLAWILCMVLFRAALDTARSPSLSWRRLPMIALAANIATCSLMYFCPHGWLATPSYNSLIFKAMLLSSIGLLLAEKAISKISITGWLLMGVGGWLAFMAKPTSAAALGVVTSICLLLTRKFNFRLIAISLLTATTLLIASAWVIDGSLVVFIERLRAAAEAVSLLAAGHTAMFRIDEFLMSEREEYFLAFSGAITFGAVCLATSGSKARVMAGYSFALLFALTSLVIILAFFLPQPIKFAEQYFYPIWKDLYPPPTKLILAVPLCALAFSFVAMRKLPGFKASRIQWGIALYFVVLPHVSAFGSNNNYWLQGSLDGYFWILAGLVLFIPAISIRSNWRIMLPVVMSGQLITVFLLQAAMERPYFNQPEPFRQYKVPLPYGINDSKLILPQAIADYHLNVKKMTNQAGFKAGTPMLDMTGEEPGTLYAIGAKAIGQPWMIGGYAGSDNLAIAMLNRVSCKDIAEAWLLVDPDSRLKLSLTILGHLGLSFEQNFEMTAELNMSSASVVRHGVAPRRLQLWKPTLTTQYRIAACEKKRITF